MLNFVNTRAQILWQVTSFCIHSGSTYWKNIFTELNLSIKYVILLSVLSKSTICQFQINVVLLGSLMEESPLLLLLPDGASLFGAYVPWWPKEKFVHTGIHCNDQVPSSCWHHSFKLSVSPKRSHPWRFLDTLSELFLPCHSSHPLELLVCSQ